jgi:GNAT superfamily N-acetyltransferase
MIATIIGAVCLVIGFSCVRVRASRVLGSDDARIAHQGMQRELQRLCACHVSRSKLPRMAQIREAELPADLDAVQRLWLAYLTWGNDGLEDRYGFRLPIRGFVERDLRSVAKFQRPDGRLLLAIAGDDAVGIACMQRIDPETAEIKRMYVDPLHRRGGLGRTMLAQLITEAQLTGCKRVRLDSPDFMTAAHSLYRASGFKDIGPYPESEIPDEYKPHWIFMERNLI